MNRFFAAPLTALALAAQPVHAGQQKPVVLENGQLQELQAGDSIVSSTPTADDASVNLIHRMAPIAPNNGGCWAIADGFLCRINGTTVAPVTALPSYSESGISGIPNSLGTAGLGLSNSSFAIRYAPSAAAGAEALQVYRTDTWTGGISGQTTAALRSYMTHPAGRATYSWTSVAIMNNNGTSTDGSQNVAVYGQTLKNSTGASWAGTFEVIETASTANPTKGTVGIEVDVRANGQDLSNNRVGIDVVSTRPLNSSVPTGPAATTGFGIRVQNGGDSSSRYTVGYGFGSGTSVTTALDTSAALVWGDAIKLGSGQTIAFDATSQHRLKYIAGSGIEYSASGTREFRATQDGGIQLRPIAVVSLPKCTASAQGSIYFVYDIAGPGTYRGPVAGGGTTQSTVECDGTSWTQH